MINIAFQGEPGAYSELVLYKYFKENSQSVPCGSFKAIFEAIYNHKSDYGVLPVENSLEGTVIPAYDELVKSKLTIQKELILPVKHCLLACKGVALSDINKVISHPQALGQCSNHIKALGITPEPFLDTAGAAKYLQQTNSRSTAAIASKLASEYYDLDILKENFEDEHYNFTRFFVLGFDKNIRLDDEDYKTSLIFSGKNKPKLLSMVLNAIAKYDIDLTKIESRPTRNQAWEYMFFLDFKGHRDDKNIQLALSEVAILTDYLNVLGSYQTVHF